MAATGVGTGGTGAAVLLGVQALLRYRKRRREQGAPAKPDEGGDTGQNPEPSFSSGDIKESEPQREMLQRDTTEAEQLIQLGRLEQRDPILDSFMGMSFHDELKADRSKPELNKEVRDYIANLHDRVMARVDKVAPVAASQSYSDRSRT